jgi:hypothetical protein
VRPWTGPIWAQDTRAVMQELKTVLGAAGLTLADGLLDRWGRGVAGRGGGGGARGRGVSAPR